MTFSVVDRGRIVELFGRTEVEVEVGVEVEVEVGVEVDVEAVVVVVVVVVVVLEVVEEKEDIAGTVAVDAGGEASAFDGSGSGVEI